MYDMTGRLVYSIATSEPSIAIPTQGLGEGVYNLIVNAGANQQVIRVAVE